MHIQFAYGNPDLFGNLSRAGDTLSHVNDWLYRGLDSWARRGSWERVAMVNSLPLVGDWYRTNEGFRQLRDTGYSPKEAAYPSSYAGNLNSLLYGWSAMPYRGKGRKSSRRRRRHYAKRY